MEKRWKANKLEAVLVKTSLQNKNLRTFSNSERHRFGGGIANRNTTIANSQMHFTNAICMFFFGIFLMVENLADEDHLMVSTFEENVQQMSKSLSKKRSINSKHVFISTTVRWDLWNYKGKGDSPDPCHSLNNLGGGFGKRERKISLFSLNGKVKTIETTYGI